MSSEHDDFDDDEHELIRADAPIDASGPEALARIIEQSNREQAASRAQARELVKTLEGVRRSQEYLGEALREERKKSRGMLVLLVLAPLVAVAGAWYVLRHVDDAKSDLERRVEQMAADAQAARADDASKRQDERSTQLASDVDALRRDLDSSREALAAERKQVAEREAALAAADNRGESAKMELGALQSEVRSARATAHAEEQRAAALERQLQDAQKALAAKPVAPPSPPPPTSAPASSSAAPAAAPSPVAAKPATTQQPEGDPVAAEKAKSVLNALLKESGDAVRYEFTSIGGVAGRSLVGVVAVGTDDQGAVVRTIQAGRAEIAVDADSKSVVLRFFDGNLLIGGKSAPFFDGRYGLVVRGDPAKWKAAASAFVKSD